MENSQLHIHTPKGTVQSERLLNALLPEYFKVDERKTSDLLAYAVEYAKLLKHYDDQDNETGDWSDFFTTDISVFLATIIAMDTHTMRQKNATLVSNILENNTKLEEKIIDLKVLFQDILSLARLYNHWYVQIATMNTRSIVKIEGIETELEQGIEINLKPELQRLKAYAIGAGDAQGIGETIELDLEEFDKIWDLHKDIPSQNPFVKGVYTNDRINYGLRRLRMIFNIFYSNILYIVRVAPKYLNESLYQKQDHKPNVALYIAFLRLFKHLQKHINTFTKKHLDFYYYDILQQSPRSYSPDSTFVYFNIANHLKNYVLEKGSRIIGPANKHGFTPVYLTQKAMAINTTQIVDIKTLFVSKSLLVGVGSSYRLIANIFAAPIANSKNGLGEPFEKNRAKWASFGEEQITRSESDKTMQAADIGFAIAAPIFFLKEGRRQVELLLNIEEESMAVLKNLIEDISTNEGTKKDVIFQRIFKEAFHISMSGEEAWIQIEKYELLPPEDWQWGAAQLTLKFVLDGGMPAVVCNNSEVLNNQYKTEFPVLQVLLNNKDTIYTYSFLRDLVIDHIDITVEVEKVRDLSIFNNEGPVDASVPFYPFTATPRIGDYCAIGNQEIFRKKLLELTFNLEWANLPNTEGGFEAYYHSYNLDINDQVFQMRLALLNKGEYHPLEIADQTKYPLFTSEAEGLKKNKLIELSEAELDSYQIKVQPHFELAEYLDNNTRMGFFKFEFCNPESGFGHTVYPTRFAEIAMANIPEVRMGGLLTKKKTPQPFPNEPYSPLMRRVSLNYKAQTKLYLGGGDPKNRWRNSCDQMYHICPFGTELIFSEGKVFQRKLVPEYEADGYLYLGLDEVQTPQELSILFILAEGQRGHTVYVPPEVQWSYLKDNEWFDFPEDHFLVDETEGFTTSGIVELVLPRAINRKNTIMPDNCYWLRVAAKGDIDVLSHTKAVYTQGTRVTWTATEGIDQATHLAQALPPFSLSDFENPISAIAKITQPFPSFGGQATETSTAFYTRLSERLNHKQRAINGKDYEKMVLSQFPTLNQVKCLTHISHPDFVASGEVIVVIVPKIDLYNRNLSLKSDTKMLRTVKAFLRQHASPFAKIQVRNPEYENMKVNCAVLFQNARRDGGLVKQLNEDILKHICPWYYDEEAPMNLGGNIGKDTILRFIETRHYVEFVTKFSITQIVNHGGFFDLKDTATDLSSSPTIEASKPWSVIVPFEKNNITILEKEGYQAPEQAAMGNLNISMDLVVQKDISLNDVDNNLEEVDEEDELLMVRGNAAIQAKTVLKESTKKDLPPKFFIKLKLKSK